MDELRDTQNLELLHRFFNDIGYSVRRYFVDDFFSRRVLGFPPKGRILDMGGKKKNKRGLFDIEKYDFKVEYANLDKNTEPDYLCDISNIPVSDNYFDGVIISEVLEHVFEPKVVLKEAYRVLKSGGKVFICVPFMYHIHADPYDFGRYTDYYFKTVLEEIGFKDVVIEKQGLFFSVLANMLKLWAYELSKDGRPKSVFKRKLFHKFVFWFQKRAFEWEKDNYYKGNKMFSGYTTGYGIICSKEI